MDRILIIEDDADIALSIKYSMERDGSYVVAVAGDGESGIAEARRTVPDLVLLDLNLPGMDGVEVCRVLRREASTADIPIVMLTARVQEQDKIGGLDVGADDYITKPFSVKELVARVRAVLRRASPRTDGPRTLVRGPLALDEARRRITVDGEEVRLTRKEFDLLVFLIAHRGEVITRERLLDEVWGYERFPTTRTVDMHVLRLRRKFEADPDRPVWILTLHGHGYKFAAV